MCVVYRGNYADIFMKFYIILNTLNFDMQVIIPKSISLHIKE